MSRGRAGGGRLRIIGGRWRGRRLAVPEGGGVRPTPDRIRETVFNWLQPVIAGARCLDLFAGTGALGLEAASRGAAEVVLVERDRRLADRLRAAASELDADNVSVVAMDARRYLAAPGRPFDIVFLDPPFRRDLLAPALAALEEGGWLAPGAYVYIESESEAEAPVLPGGWERVRDKIAGQVRYDLTRRIG